MKDVSAPREFDRVPACPAAGVENLRAGQDATVYQPRGNHGAFFTNRPIDEEVECPGIFGVERTTRGLVHHVVFVGVTTAQRDRRSWRLHLSGVALGRSSAAAAVRRRIRFVLPLFPAKGTR